MPINTSVTLDEYFEKFVVQKNRQAKITPLIMILLVTISLQNYTINILNDYKLLAPQAG